MNIPNQLSLLRILLVPGVLVCLVYYEPQREWLRLLAFGLFLLGIVTDALDGFIARKYSLQTKLGSILDPIADKTLILSILIGCSSIKGLPDHMHIPAWFNITVISRDVFLILGTSVLFVIRGDWNVHPNLLGKCTTGAQMALIVVVFLNLPYKGFLLIVATVLTILSGINYVWKALRVLD